MEVHLLHPVRHARDVMFPRRTPQFEVGTIRKMEQLFTSGDQIG